MSQMQFIFDIFVLKSTPNGVLLLTTWISQQLVLNSFFIVLDFHLSHQPKIS